MKKIFLLFTLCLFGLSAVWAQQTVTGTVTDPDGIPLPGASVVVEGTTTGTVTDIDGKYSINVTEGANTLVFSFVGMKPKEVEITSSLLDVSMGAESELLDEVIVTTYGRVNRQSFTGAASVVGSEELEKKQISNVSNALMGAAAGVQVTTNSGQPGASSTIRIRGIGSLNAGTAPLYVVDGVPYDGYLGAIDPADIESYTILKDAASTALYGSRAANGIIMITTKSGKSGKTKVEVDVKYGYNERGVPDYNHVGIPDYYRLSWEAIKNDQISSGETPPDAAQIASDGLISQYLLYNIYDIDDDDLISTDGSLNPNANLLYRPDWEDASLKNGDRFEANIGFSGGTDKLKYRLSTNFLLDEGIIDNSNFSRYSIRLNATDQINEWLKVGLNTQVGTFKSNAPVSSGTAFVNVFQFIRTIGPIYPVYARDPDNPGSFLTGPNGNMLFDFGDNAYGNNLRPQNAYTNSNIVATTILDQRKNKVDFATVRLFGEVKFLKDFTFLTTFAPDYYGENYLRYQNSLYGDAADFKGRSYRQSGRAFSFTFNQMLTYENDFDEHNVKVLVGHEAYKFRYNLLDATRTGFPGIGITELRNAAQAEGSDSYENNYRIESYFSRLQYNYNGKYFIEGSFRTDGSSRFFEDERWGTFWGVSGAWRISEENFMNFNWLDNLKLKASYGVVGNDNINTFYAYQGKYSTANPNLNRPGVWPNTVQTPEITWETSNTFDIGLEVDVFKRLAVNFDYFISKKEDLLFARPNPPSNGIPSVNQNIGDMKNSGFELEVKAKVFDSDAFKWDLDFNATWIKNEITSLPEGDVPQGIQQWTEGKTVYEFYTRKYAGVDSETGEALYYYKEVQEDASGDPVLDENGDPVFTGDLLTTNNSADADDFYLGSALPDVYGGIINNFSYKGFELSVSMAYQLGGKFYDGAYAGLMSPSIGSALHTDILNRWQQTGDVTDIPRMSYDDVTSASDRFLLDASYLSINDVNFGYNLPKAWIQKIKFTNVKLYLHVTYLHLFSKRKGLIPFQDLDGINGNVYTPMRTFSFGVNVKL